MKTKLKKTIATAGALLLFGFTTSGISNAETSAPKIHCKWCNDDLKSALSQELETALNQAESWGFQFDPRGLKIDVSLRPDLLEESNGLTTPKKIELYARSEHADLCATFAHEIGHWILSQDVKAQAEKYPLSVTSLFDVLLKSDAEAEGLRSQTLIQSGKLWEWTTLSSYDELFADAFAVYYFKNNSVMASVSKTRDFAADYPVKNWSEKESHLRFTPVRSALGKLIRFDKPTQMHRLAEVLMISLAQENQSHEHNIERVNASIINELQKNL